METKIDVEEKLHYELTGGEPVKHVKTPENMNEWFRSQAYHDILGFINGISTAIQGKRIGDEMHISKAMANLLGVFDKLNTLIDETPPTDQPNRFGNSAYRSWSRKMNFNVFVLLQEALPQEKCHLFTELGCYFAQSFGNAVRIDYGTGHELSFLFFMCALFKAEIFTEEDNVTCALRLFNTYLTFVRRLQQTYRMEPAGSQGVWALDDYQFVPFIWGSAQLCYQAPFDPSRFLDEDVINTYKTDYMFIGCIDYISKVKTGHFAEHSNQLWSISAVPSWIKINGGLVKMYQKEILGKYPIIQHANFGSLMPYKPVKAEATIKQARLGFPAGEKTQPSAADLTVSEAGSDDSIPRRPSDIPPVSHSTSEDSGNFTEQRFKEVMAEQLAKPKQFH